MRHGAAASRLQWQPRLGAVERLDLAFLVDRDDDRVGGRVHIKPDDVLNLGGEGWVGGLFEGSDAMWLQAMRPPDALDGTETNADNFGHHAAGPMGGALRGWATGQRQ